MKKLVFLLVTGLVLFSYNERENAPEKVNSTKEVSLSAEESKLIKDYYSLFSKLKHENENTVMTLFINKKGKIEAKYEIVPDLMKKASAAKSNSASEVCRSASEDYGDVEFQKCIKKHLDKNHCITISTFYYCAYECEDGIPAGTENVEKP